MTASGLVPHDIQAVIESARGSGQPLDEAARERLAPLLGETLDRVRIHADTRAATLARSVAARAFTVGDDVFFAAGQYRPGSSGGDALVAHETAHTVQQRVAPTTGPLTVSDPDDSLERQASALATAAASPLASQQHGEQAPERMRRVSTAPLIDAPRALSSTCRDPAFGQLVRQQRLLQRSTWRWSQEKDMWDIVHRTGSGSVPLHRGSKDGEIFDDNVNDLVPAKPEAHAETEAQAKTKAHAETKAGPTPAGRVRPRQQVLTRLSLTQRADKQYSVGDVVIAGRTPSPFPGTMGAHSTAWVAHIDELRRVLVNRPLRDAAKHLVGLVNSELVDPSGHALALEKALPEAQQRLLTDARKQANESTKKIVELVSVQPIDVRAAAPAPAPDAMELVASAPPEHGLQGAAEPALQEEAPEAMELVASPAQVPALQEEPESIYAAKLQAAVQALVNHYLTFVNYLPGATVVGGDPAGHGEGAARADITEFEYVYALFQRNKVQPKTDATKAEQPLLKAAVESASEFVKAAWKVGFKPEKCKTLTNRLIKDQWVMFAAETPDIFLADIRTTLAKKVTRLDVWRLLVKNFLKTIARAYPYTFQFTEMDRTAVQRQGLKSAIEQELNKRRFYVETIGDEFLKQLITRSEPLAPPKVSVRPASESAEVTESDFFGGGSQFAVTVLLEATSGDANEDPVVGAVEMIGRTQSPFSGTMGAHSTAWVVHLDVVQSLLRGKTLEDATVALCHEAAADLKAPVLKYINLLDENHSGYLVLAYNELKDAIGTVRQGKSAVERLAHLEFLIRRYLTYVNFLPMSTVQIALPGGRAEGQARKFLLAYEELGKQAVKRPSPEELKAYLLALYDPTPVDKFPPELVALDDPSWMNRPDYKWTKQHELWGPYRASKKAELTRQEADEKEQNAWTRFYNSVSKAYPQSVADSKLAFDDLKAKDKEEEYEGSEESEGDFGSKRKRKRKRKQQQQLQKKKKQKRQQQQQKKKKKKQIM